jgi:hypothetical protein
MSKNYFIEIWLRGDVKDYICSFSPNSINHPHITLVRPFSLKIEEENLKSLITDFCYHKKPIKFTLGKTGYFLGRATFLEVGNERELLNFSNNLEEKMDSFVNFSEKIGEKKLHATIERGNKKIQSNIKVNDYMLRLTTIRSKKIWFSYDFVKNIILNREESLDEKLWKETTSLFKKFSN